MIWRERFAEIGNLRRAWRSVRHAGGGEGVDGISIEQFGARSEQELAKISQQIAAQRYRFSKLRVAMLPKPNGQLRKLGIPTVADRVVLQTIRQVVEPVCDRHMSGCSHAYRPGRGVMTALAEIAEGLQSGCRYVLESDIASFFDSIHHPSLIATLKRIDPLLAREQLVCKSMTLSSGLWAARKGVCQGSPLSPLLANIALIDFDRQMEQAGYRLVRYADDFIVLSRTESEMEAAKKLAETLLAGIHLKLHSQKTRMIDSQQTSLTFLGFELHPDRIVPTAKNLSELRSGIAACCNPLDQIAWPQRIDRINGLLRSFAWYYHQTDSKRIFWALDAYVEQQLDQLAAMLGQDDRSWRDRLIRISDMREISWRSTSGRKKRGWSGYGK